VSHSYRQLVRRETRLTLSLPVVSRADCDCSIHMAGTEIDGDSERLLDDDQADVERQRAVGLVGGLPRCCDSVRSSSAAVAYGGRAGGCCVVPLAFPVDRTCH